jgi:hypothetical protein
MQIGQVSTVGAVLIGVMGAGYAVTGNPDFEVKVHRSPEAVYAAFATVNPANTVFQEYGLPVQHVTVTREPGRRIVFFSPTENDGQPLQIALTFAAGSAPATTLVTAAIDVPPIPMRVDGTDKYLSEDKVETQVREAIGELAKRIDDGNSTTSASHKFATLIEAVAVASHPQKLKAAVETTEAKKKAAKEFRERYEADGWQFKDDGTAEKPIDTTPEYGDPGYIEES